MNLRLRLTPRQWLIVLHDLAVTAAAILTTFLIRFEGALLEERLPGLFYLLPPFVVFAGGIYFAFGLYKAKWRFASVPDLVNIFRVATVLAVSLLVLDYILLAPNLYGTFFFGKITILLYWVLQMAFLGGPRIAYRYFRYTRIRNEAKAAEAAPTLIVGRAADAEVLLRAVESGAVKKIWPVGIISPSPADRGQSIRGVSVFGDYSQLSSIVADLATSGTNVSRVVLTPSAFAPEARPEGLLMVARRLGLTVSRLPSLDEGGEPLRLAPVAVEDLLLRPSVKIDYQRLEKFIAGKSVIVTGGGGSIGAEICDRVVTFGAERLLIIENSEPALYAVLENLAARAGKAKIEGRLADVRDRERIFALFNAFKPDIVFHAAALKHVPLLETDWSEAVKTNVFGSVHVADAAVASGAAGMVLVSTDKAVEPVSVLGATKRFAEMYCQALDAELARQAASGVGAVASEASEASASARLIAVRFGNVLASTGSVIPKFKAQIAAGGPVTVTHPGMVRYFMTIREACDLVLSAAAHALAAPRAGPSIYVLNMGQPVRILALAERLIRLSGLVPGRDIDIVFTGPRPGERLTEKLFSRQETTAELGLAGVLGAAPRHPPLPALRACLAALQHALAQDDRACLYRALREAVAALPGLAPCGGAAAAVESAPSAAAVEITAQKPE
ncbi:MAG TPA: nucleoside-diphosphate sugar epimerase/dehydratase [Xanthobacteraceae bacterium]|nr:nucleoside-diphosphate sugar epimerase/dehydratase [Xanthobacteraceae bacterium]